METSNCDVYQIFMCDDKCTSQNYDTRHNYLIIGVDEPCKGLGLVQAMSITSMHEKEVKIEVPVKLSNNLVSYILPYNIHSFKPKDFSNRDYKGTLRDTSYCTREEFVSLLMRLYIDSLGVNSVDHDEVMRDYHAYCEAFWENNQDSKEYREEKAPTVVKETVVPEVIEPVKPVIQNKPISTPSKKSSNKDYSKYNEIYKQLTTNKTTRKKMGNKKRRDERREEKSIKAMMRACVGSNVEEVEQENSIKELKVPYKNFEIELEDMIPLEKSSKILKDWKDDDILLFMKGYKKFGFKAIHALLPTRWKSAPSMSKWFNACKEESIKRNLPPFMALKQVSKPISSWKDTDIKYYLSLMENHKNDEQFMLDITGYDNIELCYQTTYKVKEEAKKRNIKMRGL